MFDDCIEKVFRCCPKCARKWSGVERHQWRADTKLVDVRLRRQGYEQDGARYDYKIHVETREHRDCGGKMYDPGKVVSFVTSDAVTVH